MKNFEYKTVYFAELKNEHYQEFDANKLNALGADGWELVSTGGQCVFKREVVETEVKYM